MTPRRMNGIAAAAVLALLLLQVTGCGGKPQVRTSESALDSPRTAYERGKAQLASGEIDDALGSFKRAVELDPEFAPGWEGQGLVALERGDVAGAEQHFQKSRDKDGEYVPARVGMARVRTAQGKYEEAEGELKDVLKDDPGNLDAHYWAGKNYAAWGRDGEAMGSFQEMLRRDPGNQPATEAMFEMARNKAATTGVPPEYVELAAVPDITRQDLAALVAVELEPTRLFRKPDRTEASATDAPADGMPADVPTDHWAAPYIQACLESGMLDLFPGGKFMPKRPVTRADFAMTLERALVAATGDRDLQTRYVGSRSEYADVPADHYALNAIKVCTTRGLMSAQLDGKFHPTGPVSGTDALLMLGKLRDLVR